MDDREFWPIDHAKIKEGHIVFGGNVHDQNNVLIGPVPRINPDDVIDEIIIGNIERHIGPGDYGYFESKHKFESWGDIKKMKFPEERWRIKNMIPLEGFTILAGISGERKTWVAMEMAKSIVQGIDFLGHFKTLGGNILYIDMEMSKSEFQRRGLQLGLSEDKYKFFILSQNELNLNDDGDEVEGLIEYIEKNKIVTVFVDTFRAVAGGMEENKAELVRKFFNRFKPLKDKGVGVVFLDHFRKPNHFEGKVPKKEHLFASQDKIASVETLLMIQSMEISEEIHVYQRKNRLGMEIKPFKIGMADEDTNGVRKTNLKYLGEIEEAEIKKDEAKKAIPIYLEEGSKTTKELMEAIATEFKIGERNLRDALRELVEEKKIEQKMKGRMHIYSLKKEENPEIEGDFSNLIEELNTVAELPS